MPIANSQGAVLDARKTMGSFIPHPANIGKIAGAHMGISSPKKLARGGIGGMANAENISQNMFSPIGPSGGIPNVDVNFITSPQMQNGAGPPAAHAAQPGKEPDPMSELAGGIGAANGITDLYNKFGGAGGISGAIPSFLNPASAAENAGLAQSIAGDAGSADLLNIIGADGAGASAIAADAGATAAASTMPEWLTAAFAFLKDGGAVPGYAEGGDIAGLQGTTNMLMRREANETFHPSGLLNSAGPGRTDTINTNVPTGAYVIPADVVSGLGEGNTLAGSAVIDRMFGSSPHGIKAPQIRRGRGAPSAPSSAPHESEPAQTVDAHFIESAGAYAKGGKAQDKAPVVVAGGEHVLSPAQIINKFGSLKKGHSILDHWVVLQRQKIAKEMMKLPNPSGSKVRI